MIEARNPGTAALANIVAVLTRPRACCRGTMLLVVIGWSAVRTR
jgi:hypothetical protein